MKSVILNVTPLFSDSILEQKSEQMWIQQELTLFPQWNPRLWLSHVNSSQTEAVCLPPVFGEAVLIMYRQKKILPVLKKKKKALPPHFRP